MLWTWQRFDKQAPALAACAAKRAEAEAEASPLGLSAHARSEPWMVTAMDTDDKGNKAYAVTTPAAAFAVCCERDREGRVDDRNRAGVRVGRHQYEVLMPDEELRLYYDAEFEAELNPGADGDAMIRTLHGFWARAYAEIAGRPREALTDDAVAVETSHRAGKLSYHGKLRAPWGVARHMTDERLFQGRVAALITDAAAAGDAAAQALFVKAYKKDKGKRAVVTQLFCDMHVYTTYRLMRFLGACKWPRAGAAPSHLVPRGGTRAEITYDAWRASLVSVRLRPADDAAPPVLAMPAAWQAHVPAYWKTPIAVPRAPVAPSPGPEAAAAADNAADAAALAQYRAALWPLALLEKLATFGGAAALSDRELAFQDARGTYLRHVAYPDGDALRKLLAKHRIAAVHVGTAATHGSVPGTDLRRCALRELVLDVDVSDYDKGAVAGVRTCACAGEKRVCYDCWLLVELAAAVIRDALGRRMGVPEERVLWVWSGARGMHVWVNDLAVLTLTPSEREAVYQRFLELPPLALPLAPEVERVFEHVVVPAFTAAALRARNFLTRARLAQWAAWLEAEPDEGHSRSALLPSTGRDAPFATALRAILADPDPYRCEGSLELWQRVRDAYAATRRDPAAPKAHSLYWLVAQYAWPRVDQPVTFGKRKTLRAPFSLNPRGRTLALPMAAPGSAAHTEAHWRAVSAVALDRTAQHKETLSAARERFAAWLRYYGDE